MNLGPALDFVYGANIQHIPGAAPRTVEDVANKSPAWIYQLGGMAWRLGDQVARLENSVGRYRMTWPAEWNQPSRYGFVYAKRYNARRASLIYSDPLRYSTDADYQNFDRDEVSYVPPPISYRPEPEGEDAVPAPEQPEDL